MNSMKTARLFRFGLASRNPFRVWRRVFSHVAADKIDLINADASALPKLSDKVSVVRGFETEPALAIQARPTGQATRFRAAARMLSDTAPSGNEGIDFSQQSGAKAFHARSLNWVLTQVNWEIQRLPHSTGFMGYSPIWTLR